MMMMVVMAVRGDLKMRAEAIIIFMYFMWFSTTHPNHISWRGAILFSIYASAASALEKNTFCVEKNTDFDDS